MSQGPLIDNLRCRSLTGGSLQKRGWRKHDMRIRKVNVQCSTFTGDESGHDTANPAVNNIKQTRFLPDHAARYGERLLY